MAYIGNQLAQSYISFAKQDFTTSVTTAYTLDYPVANENEIALFINFVRQEPTTAYTASGTSLTLSSATSASDDMYAIFIGKAVQTVTPASGSITNAMLSSGSFTNITDVGTLASGLTLSDNILLNTASKGIYLGVTSATASNLLDDYEEGTWTATFSGTTTTSTGYYTKIGNLVHVQVYSGALNVTSATSAVISGLPFASNADYLPGTITHNTYAPNADNGHFSNNGTTFAFITENSTSGVTTSIGTRYVMMAGTYIAN